MRLSRRNFIASAVAVTAATGRARTPDVQLKKGALGKYVGELAAGRYDAHVHVYPGEPNPGLLVKSFAEAGLTGGVAFSRCPNSWQTPNEKPLSPEEAMDGVIAWCSGSPSIYPFYWIDPAVPNACELVDMAVEKGIYGFKVIRNGARPVDATTLPCYRRIATVNKPVTFHSGILRDGRDSSDSFRPANWEGLLEVPYLRFALAHISWPWCDECIAVYGKMLNAISRRGFDIPEMFIDTTPGTPKIFRREVLAKVFTIGYDVADHVMFGTDCRVNGYRVGWSKDWQSTDDGIFAELGIGGAALDSVYRTGLQRYLFGGDNTRRKVPTPDGREGNGR